MPTTAPAYAERPLVKSKIVATVGPSCDSPDRLRELAQAGVDVFRLNFAHGAHEALAKVAASIRSISRELGRPIALLGDLSGPKIRLGELPAEGLRLQRGELIRFSRQADPSDPRTLTCTYKGLIDDVQVGDDVLLADGSVSLRATARGADELECEVIQPGLIRSRQGINLPGVRLRVPCLTPRDLLDLDWALSQRLDFVGLSFVRSPNDIQELRRQIAAHPSGWTPWIVAKIEKPQALDDLEEIIRVTDAVMVARGDLGVEVDIVRLPGLQKRIIRACNRHRVPVITATQMLDSMQEHDRPTRAEASDVANAVWDGSDALMLSGETAIGKFPVESVSMMSRIASEAESLVTSTKELPMGLFSRNLATEMTRAVTLGAIHAAEQLSASLLVVLTRSGTTAIAVSELRSRVPILALTDDESAARRLCLAWGVTPVVTAECDGPTSSVVSFAMRWGQERGVLQQGDRLVLVGTTDWSQVGKNLLEVHIVP